MIGWQAQLVKDIASMNENALSTGPFGSSISSRYFQPAGVPVIRGGNLSEEISTRLNDEGLVFVSEEKAAEFRRSIVRRGDLVFTCWGTINQVGLIDERAKYDEYLISNKQMKLTPDPKKADSLFLYYLFSSPAVQYSIVSNGIGSSVPGFNLGQLKTMELLLPSVEEQEEIANILGSIDEKIELNRKQNHTLEAIAQALFKRWFVEFEFPDKNGQPYKSSGGAMWPSELGGIPVGWEVCRLSDVSNISIGRTPPRKEKEWFSTDPKDNKWISIKDLGSADAYINKTSEFLTDEAIKKFRVPLIPENTVVVSFKLTVGRVAITTGKMCSNEAIAQIQIVDTSRINDEFLYYVLRNFDFDSLGSTSSIATAVNSQSIKLIPVLVPMPGIASEYRTCILPLMAKIKNNIYESKSLSLIRDTLLPKLMSGELRIKDTELAMEAIA